MVRVSVGLGLRILPILVSVVLGVRGWVVMVRVMVTVRVNTTQTPNPQP